MMPNYEVGTRVTYVLKSSSETKSVPCSVCKGVPIIFVKKVKYTCNACYGSGYEIKCTTYKEKKTYSGKIIWVGSKSICEHIVFEYKIERDYNPDNYADKFKVINNDFVMENDIIKEL